MGMVRGMTIYTATLPWFPKELSTNGQHGHWAPRAKATKAYREACAWQAKAQGWKPVTWQSVLVHLVFFPPDKRRRDGANCLSSSKALLDGLADVLGVDDSKFRVSFEMAPVIGGMVRVTVREYDEVIAAQVAEVIR